MRGAALRSRRIRRAGGRLALLLALGLGLAGCDDGTVITRVHTEPLAQSSFTVAGLAGLATEVHGAPFAGMTAEAVVARLRPPVGQAQTISFRLATPGEAAERIRLVLVYNRTTAPDGIRDCRDTGRGQALPVSASPPEEVGFTVTTSLCDAERRLASAHMEARRTRADDPAEFTRVMRLALMQLVD